MTHATQMRSFFIKAILFLLLASNKTLAENSKNNCDNLNWQCHGSFYITAGYISPYDYYTDHPSYVTIPTKSVFSYTPQNAFPRSFNGLRIGYGMSPDPNHWFTYEVFYNQLFRQSKIHHERQFSLTSKSVLGLLEYTFNPKSRMGFTLLSGASITSNTLTIHSENQANGDSITTTGVDIFPGVGAKLSYQINSKFAVKFATLWFLGTDNKTLYGSLVPAFLLSYYP